MTETEQVNSHTPAELIYWLKMSPGTTPTSTPLHPNFINNLSPGFYLDVGCGSGRISHELRNRGHRVVGIDANFLELLVGKKNYPDIPFIQALGEQLPFAESMFDGAVLLGVLGAVGKTERQKILEDTIRCIGPSGVIYISEFARIGEPNKLTADGKRWVDVYEQDRGQTQEDGSVIVQNSDGTPIFIAHHFTEEELIQLLKMYDITPSICEKMDVRSMVSKQFRESITIWGYK